MAGSGLPKSILHLPFILILALALTRKPGCLLTWVLELAWELELELQWELELQLEALLELELELHPSLVESLELKMEQWMERAW